MYTGKRRVYRRSLAAAGGGIWTSDCSVRMLIDRCVLYMCGWGCIEAFGCMKRCPEVLRYECVR